jgi:hypothetical protein
VGVRKRFSKAEQTLLASGAALEWQNVTQWHAVTLVPGAHIVVGDGWQSIDATADVTRGTVRSGDKVWITPGHVRARAPQVTDARDGMPFDHVCSAVWAPPVINGGGHAVHTCRSGRHIAIMAHPDSGHTCGGACTAVTAPARLGNGWTSAAPQACGLDDCDCHLVTS